MSDAPVGRPRGETDKSVQLRRELRAMAENGIKPADMAHIRGLSESRVRELLKDDPAEDGSPAPAAIPKEPKPYSPRVLLWRAWLVAHMHPPAAKLPAAAKLFWLSAVQAVATYGDGLSLSYADLGYLDRADFCELHDVTQGDLDLLVRRRLLAELTGGTGIALPKGLGLVPRERSIDSPKSENSRSAGRGRRTPGQTELLHVFPGGLADNAEADAEDPEFNRGNHGKTPQTAELNRGNFNGKINQFDAENHGKTPDGDVAPPVVVVGKSQINHDLNNNNNSTPLPRAGANDGAGNGKIPENHTDIKSKQTVRPAEMTPTELTREVVGLAPITRQPDFRDTEMVQTWQAAGLTNETIIDVVQLTLEHAKPAKVSSLRYFTQAMRNEIARRKQAAAEPSLSTAAAPSPPISDEDRALLKRLIALQVAWSRDRSKPLSPALSDFKAAVAAGKGLQAHRWLGVFEEAEKVELAGSGTLPRFALLERDPEAFARHLDAAEDTLTAPNLRHAAD